MKDRSAVNTIRGYFYQFDYSILSVLQLPNPGDSIAVECIEDVDIFTATDVSAVQCKYYAGTEYNHSVIKPAVMHMLTHFDTTTSPVKYSLRGHYNAGHHKLTVPFNVAFLKQHFLTYIEKKTERRHHEDLGLSDDDLERFLSVLDVDINAASFEKQYAEVIQQLQTAYSCSPFTAEYYYYNNALARMRSLSIQPLPAHRTITKKDFLVQSDTSSVLFNEWFVQTKGEKAYFAALRKEYFTALNTSPFERFFLIEVDPTTYLRSDLKVQLHTIAEKWSKTTKRDGESSFCPYIYVHGLPDGELVALKKELAAEEFSFIDGYDFLGADFNVNSITQPATYTNGIQLKVVNSIADLRATVDAVTKTREVYQFHKDQSYFDPTNQAVRHIKIQLHKLTDIQEII